MIGIYQRAGDLKVNPCKKKALTNMRASGKDATVVLSEPIPVTLDYALEVRCGAAEQGGWGRDAAACVLCSVSTCAVVSWLRCPHPAVYRRRLPPPFPLPLQYIADDELVEVTPTSVRMRKSPKLKRTGRGTSN